MQERDLEAGQRLRDAVNEAYGKPRLVENDYQLSKESGIARSTLDGYFDKGIQPSAANMRRMADALGVTAESLWLRWLGYEPPEPGLSRIAEEIKELRDVLGPVSRRGIDAARQDWDPEQDPDRRADAEPPDGPDTPPT